jgi:hypothetical protein
MYRYIKAVSAFVGSVSPWTVVGVLTVLHVHVDTTQVVTVAALASPILGTLATLAAPKNAETKAADDAAAEDLATEVDGTLDAIVQKLSEKPEPFPRPPTP